MLTTEGPLIIFVLGGKERDSSDREGKKSWWRGQSLYHKWVVEMELFYLGVKNLDHSVISCSSSAFMGRSFSCNTFGFWTALQWWARNDLGVEVTATAEHHFSVAWEDLAQLASANNLFFSHNDEDYDKNHNPKCEMWWELSNSFFYSIRALIWQRFTTESEEPLEITVSGSSSLYVRVLSLASIRNH